MNSRLKRIILLLSAPALILLSLDKIGGSSIAPGHNTRFQYSIQSSDSYSRLSLRHDADGGTIDCYIDLVLHISPADLKALTVLPYIEDTLLIEHKGNEKFRICSKDKNKIHWDANSEIRLIAQEIPASMLKIMDWEVSMENDLSDSFSKATWRKYWFWTSLVLLFFALMGSVFGILPDKKKLQPFTIQYCITQLILRMEGNSSRQTRWMQTVLKKVLLEGVMVREALNGIPLLSKIERMRFWFKTRDEFRSRLVFLAKNLDRAIGQLGGNYEKGD